jgi:TrkA domain protein
MDVKEVLLPGVGLRYEFTSRAGDRIGIIARRGGDFDVVLYARDDPDQARPVFRLNDEEADAVAQILGAPRIAERFTELTREVPGLQAGQVHIEPGSPFVDRPCRRAPARPPEASTDVQGNHLPLRAGARVPSGQLFHLAGDGVDPVPAAVRAENLGRGVRVVSPDGLHAHPAQHRGGF